MRIQISPPEECATEFLLGDQLNGDKRSMNDDTRFWLDRTLHQLGLLSLIVAGALGVISHELFSFSWDRNTIPEFGKALIIAGTLGFTIEPWIRKAMAKDVFRAAFGYNMPQEFREQLVKIASHRIICTRHVMEVRIAETMNNMLRITMSIEREFKNIGIRPVLHRAFVHRDEWDFDEKTIISRCQITSGTRRKVGRQIAQEDATILFRSPRMIMLRGHTVVCFFEYTETRHRNDDLTEVFFAPTKDPEIRIISYPPWLKVRADFGTEHRMKVTSIPDRYQIDGVYFPPAHMRVRWWPRDRND